MHQHQAMESTDVFNPQNSETDIPLTATTHEPRHQQWDQHGRAIGYAPDPNIHSPAPRNPKILTSAKALEEGTRNPFEHSVDAGLASAGWDMGRTASAALSNDAAFNHSANRSLSPPLMNPHPSGPRSSNLMAGAAPPVQPGSSSYETDYSLVSSTQQDHAFNPFSNASGPRR